MSTDSRSPHSQASSPPSTVSGTLSPVVQAVRRYGVPIAIFGVALLLRVWAIATPLNTDEAKWLRRGAEFLHYLLAGDWGETYTTPHPGVPNMWVIGLGMGLNRLLGEWFNLGNMPQALLFPDTLFPIQWYVVPRLLQALISSACMVGFYGLTKRLLGNAIALLATVLLLFEPFFLSYQRFITTDALQTSFGMLGILGLMLYLQRQYFKRQYFQSDLDTEPNIESPVSQRSLWIFSGVMMGLAIASKLLTLFAIPGLLVWIAVMTVRHRTIVSAKGLILDLMKWSGIVLLTVVLIWPALWTQPGYTLNRMLEGLIDEETRSYFFFRGELTDSPGLLFYPVVLAWRLSLFLWLGLLGSGITVILSPVRRRVQTIAKSLDLVSDTDSLSSEQSSLVSTCGGLVLITMGYLGVLSCASTKIDRYISLMIPLLAILSAFGLLGFNAISQVISREEQDKRRPRWLADMSGEKEGEKSKNKRSESQILRSPQALPILSALFLTASQLTGLLPHMPYGLTYYNPMLGGIYQAQQMLMVGQGEGLDKMAQWLNQQPDAETMTVASWYRSVLAAYFDGNVSPLDSDRLPDERFWDQSHRVVLYKNQLQRQLPSADFLDYIQQQRSLHTITEHGVDYAIAYPGPIALDSDIAAIQYPQSLPFGSRIQLQGYDVDWLSTGSPKTLSETPNLVLTLYWTLLKQLPKDVGVYVEVRDRANQIVHQSTTPLLGGFYATRKLTPGRTIRDVHTLSFPNAPKQTTPRIPPGYSIRVGWRSLSDVTDQEPLGNPIFGPAKIISPSP